MTVAIANCRLQRLRPGNIRLSYQVTDDDGHKIEGAYLFTIVGERLRRQRFPLQRSGIGPRPARISTGARRSISLMNTNRSGGIGAAVRAAGQWRLSAAEIACGWHGKSAARRNCGDEERHAEFLCRSGDDCRWQAVHRSRSKLSFRRNKRVFEVNVAPSSETYKPGQKATVDLKLTDSCRQTVRRLDRRGDLRQSGRIHFRRQQCGRYQRVLLEMAAHALPADETNLGAPILESGAAQADGRWAIWACLAGTIADETIAGQRLRHQAVRPVRWIGGRPDDEPRHAMFGAVACAGSSGRIVAAERRRSPGRSRPESMVQPTVRTNFADTALWAGAAHHR